MSPKITRPKVVPGFTIERRSACGKIYTTVTLSPTTSSPMEVFIRFGKAGGCGSAMADGIARLVSYGLRSGLEPADVFKALTGIGCHLGANTCLNCVAESIGIVLEHLKTGRDLNDLIEEADFAVLNQIGQGADHHEI